MIIKTYCARMDHGGCGILAHVEDGKITKIEGDPDSPLSRGTVCAKGLAQTERLNHPDRLIHPMKRIGEKGERKWKQISWDEALGAIAEKMSETIKQEGQKAISFAQGTPKGLELYLMIRLANLLNIPNIATPGNVCHMPRETASNLTCGFFPVPDYSGLPSCVIVWGSNLFQTNEEGIMGSQLREVMDKGAKLIVIDPRKTAMASRADLWLQPRPGSDLALALGMLKVIIDKGLYEKTFVESWTKGFPELVDHLQQYPLDRVSEITWLPKEQVVKAASLFSQLKPACIQWGNALEHNLNSVQCARTLLILIAITGNLEVPGGNALIHPETASRFGIDDGDWVAIETKRGAIRQKAKLSSEIDPRVIVLSFGWWFPERKDLELSGWEESNLNILTENGPPYDPAIGSVALRAVLCRVYKSEAC